MEPELIIETRNLSYRFGNQLVLDQVSLNVGEGSVYGFIGPNGAGKTTTIKVLLNLLQTGEEKVFLFGKDLNKNRVEILSGIGSLIEQPAIYSHLSGRENLLNRALLLQVHSVKVHEMLDLVNLTEHADKKAGQYSLGMKQLEIQTNDLVSSKELLCRNGYQAEILSDTILIPYLSENHSAEINSLLVKHDHKVYSLTMSKQNLENLFLSITQI